MARVALVATVLAVSPAALADNHTTLVADARAVLLADATATKLAAAPSLLAHLDDPRSARAPLARAPADHAESEEDVITDHLCELGNTLGRT